MKMTKKSFAWAAVCGLMLVGCGADNGCPDGGCLDGGLVGDGPTLYYLSYGMNNYKITGATNVNDGCDLEVGTTLVNMTLPVNYDGTTYKISIGEDFGSPPTPALGSGQVNNNMSTLTRENEAGKLPCTWHQKDVSTL